MNAIKYNKKLEDIFISIENLESLFTHYDQSDKYCPELEYINILHLLHNASLRFIKFNEGIEFADKISDIMNEKYPNFKNNIYYKKNSFKFKVYCELLYKKRYKTVNMLSNIKSKIKRILKR